MIKSAPGSFGLPRVEFGHAPTPVEEISEHQELWGGPIILKREDMIDELGCGNKLRRLEYVVAHALEQGVDTLVSYGSQRSNQTKAIAVCAARASLDCHLIFGGDTQERPVDANGNYLLTRLSGGTVEWFERTPWNEMEALAETRITTLRSQGKRPYLVPSGAGMWPGILGTYDMAVELNEQLRVRGIRHAAVIVPVGSASTVTGIQLANLINGYGWVTVGVCVSAPKEVGIAGCERLSSMIPANIMPRGNSPKDFASSITWYDEVPNRGYDTFTPEELAAMASYFRASGVIFEPNYMLKCCRALPELRKSDIFHRDLPCVLIHTGGHFSIFDMPHSTKGFADW